MAPKKAAGENSKKASGNAKKAEAAAQRAAAEEAKKAIVEETEWSKGAKSTAKKEAEAAKKAEQARKKAEKDAILAAEEKEARAAPKNTKSAAKKTSVAPSRGLDLSQLDDDASPEAKLAALNASGIDNALDALAITTGDNAAAKIDRHPERRFKAAYAAFEERRLREMENDGSGDGLRQNQKKEKIKKEFEKSEENPFNQASAKYDASKEELREIREKEKAKIEARLGTK
ncbi:hypothetical protein B7463_g10406, partial [Scytalidium lignicola]